MPKIERRRSCVGAMLSALKAKGLIWPAVATLLPRQFFSSRSATGRCGGSPGRKGFSPRSPPARTPSRLLLPRLKARAARGEDVEYSAGEGRGSLPQRQGAAPLCLRRAVGPGLPDPHAAARRRRQRGDRQPWLCAGRSCRSFKTPRRRAGRRSFGDGPGAPPGAAQDFHARQRSAKEHLVLARSFRHGGEGARSADRSPRAVSSSTRRPSRRPRAAGPRAAPRGSSCRTATSSTP